MDNDDITIVVAAILTTPKPGTRADRLVDRFEEVLDELAKRGGAHEMLRKVTPPAGSIYDRK